MAFSKFSKYIFIWNEKDSKNIPRMTSEVNNTKQNIKNVYICVNHSPTF